MAPSPQDREGSAPNTMQDESDRFEELSDTTSNSRSESNDLPLSDDNLRPSASTQSLPPWLADPQFNLIHDELVTDTTDKQQATLDSCLPLLTGKDNQGLELNSHGLPQLRRAQHLHFLQGTLGSLPEGFVVIDASRPWFFYWAFAGMTTLGEDVKHYKERLQETLRPLQNASGGFGGGHGQLSHCAATYGCILALACVDGLDMVDRRAMWHWLGSVKQSDGGFRMAVTAEEDIRGAYCSMTIITILNLPLELPPEAPARAAGLTHFTDLLGEWVGRCQTYEGGMSAAPGNEAHGAYAFCGLACLSILDAPHRSIPKYLDVQALVRCLTSLQTTPEGGFAGRTNKLVDACYSHWVGGCWALIEAALRGNGHAASVRSHSNDVEGHKQAAKAETESRSSLWNREALIRYLLCCCQQPGKRGGMRDKPSARPDGYHTCYSLAGLSAAQNHYIYNNDTTDSDADADAHVVDASGRLTAAFNWRAERSSEAEREAWKIDDEDVVEFVHPVFVIGLQAVERAREQFKDGGLGASSFPSEVVQVADDRE